MYCFLSESRTTFANGPVMDAMLIIPTIIMQILFGMIWYDNEQ